MPGRRTPAAHENDLPGAGTDDSGHRASVLEARDQFLATRSNKPVGVRDLIGESWLRSRRWAVAADRLVPHPVNRDLDPPIVDIARPILQRLAGRLAGQQIGLLLTDADAVLLLRFAKDPTFRRRLDRAASLPGYSSIPGTLGSGQYCDDRGWWPCEVSVDRFLGGERGAVGPADDAGVGAVTFR